MAQQAQPILSDEQYKDLIVFQSHQHFEAVKMAAQHAQRSMQAMQSAESLAGQLKEANDKIAALTPPPAEPDPLPVAPPVPSPPPLPQLEAIEQVA